MAAGREVAGGGREVLVAPERLIRWREGFAARHGAVTEEAGPVRVRLLGADGATAEVAVPFPPLADPSYDALVAHATRPRLLGLLLVRLGGFAMAVADGERLIASRTGSRPVHGRSAAGGWSQQRFARRRDGQARVALAAAADRAAEVLLPSAAHLAALVAGGDRAAVAAVLADRRLEPLRGLLLPGLLTVGEPRRAALDAAPAQARLVRVLLRDPPVG